jgi:hypothetical protein
MNDPIDDDLDGPSDAPRVPPPPSVTPGSAPPPPVSATGDASDPRGCLAVLTVGAVLAVAAIVVAIVLVVVGTHIFGSSSSDDAKALQEVFVETGIASASTDAVHPPQRDISLGRCEGDGSGGVRAAGTLTNWTSEPADYSIDVSFRRAGSGAAGEEFAARTVEVDAVPEHSTTNWESVAPDGPDSSFACRIVAINRWKTGTRPPS